MQRRTAVLGAVAAGALVLGGTAAYAEIVGPDNTINACVANKTGVLRIVGPDKPACAKTETALSWNQQGIPGSPGAPGINGVDGTNGINGVNGQDGVSGLTPPIESTFVTVPPSSIGSKIATCPPGKVAISGGWEGISGSAKYFHVLRDMPTNDGKGWIAEVFNSSTDLTSPNQDIYFKVRVVCANAN